MSKTDIKSTKTVLVPVFDGKKSQFGIWWPRFKTYCVMKGISEVLQETFTLPIDPKIIPSGDDAKKEHQLKIGKNAACAAALTLEFTTPTLMEMITSTENK